MKRIITRLLLPAAALLGLSSCVDPYLAYGGGPGYSPHGGYRGYSSAPLAYRNTYSPSRSYSSGYYPRGSTYGSPYRSYSGHSSAYQPVGFPGLGLFGSSPFYSSRSSGYHPRYSGRSSYRGGGLGYYPNDPDDRNNPSHPNYIGPAGSRASRYAPQYYANDPDDRNNPSHPNYIGPAGSRYRSYNPGHNYHANDPDDRNNPSHPDYIGPPLN